MRKADREAEAIPTPLFVVDLDTDKNAAAALQVENVPEQKEDLTTIHYDMLVKLRDKFRQHWLNL